MADTTNIGDYTYTTTSGSSSDVFVYENNAVYPWKRVDVAGPETFPVDIVKDLLWATIELTDYIKQQAAKRGESTDEVLEAMLVLAKNILAVEDKADEHGKEVEK